jgi:hypothetical protein
MRADGKFTLESGSSWQPFYVAIAPILLKNSTLPAAVGPRGLMK